MDKDVRNAIERATQRARKLLEGDFAAQLEGDFDVHRDGTVAAKAGGHLSARQVFRRERIVAAIEHKAAAGMSAADAARDYLRDGAFTTLNRFVALKMLEARDLVQECITKGEQSAGYREFCGMAPGLPLLPDSAGYRLYIESLFDELSTEVKVLFDRRDPCSVLWPRRATFEQLLEILNAIELAKIWGEDETIGWVYQFFNDGEERKKMRDPKQGGSQAPRDRRELAVRNQFFTPRYVVQFLTDNTLGRIWYEMRACKTVLADKCEYMVRHPNEFPIAQVNDHGESWVAEVTIGKWSAIPEDFSWKQSAAFAHLINGYEIAPVLGYGDAGEFANQRREAAEQSGVWEGTAVELWISLFFEHRRYRHFGHEPEERELALLNALCKHLRVALLAAEQEGRAPMFFAKRAKKDPRDLRVLDPACGSGHFLLYAFDLLLAIYEEAHADQESPRSEVTGKTLAEDYSSVDSLRKAVPGLVLAHKLYGVDIDPRCAQIAQLALWMRAQKAYRDVGIGRNGRAQVRRSNIVVAEPLVADDQLAKEFVAKLDNVELGRVFRSLVDSLSLAGDMGLLLRVEDLVARQTERGHTGDLFAPPEHHIRSALARFASDSEAQPNTRRRLFVDDTAHGMALLGVAEKKFDAVLMNPPFGAGSLRAKTHFEKAYPRTKNDVYAAFIERGIELLSSHGRLGAITSRTGFFLSSFQRWREEILLKEAPPVVVADLGLGVMDAAMVEAAAYCLERDAAGEHRDTVFLRVLDELIDKDAALRTAIRNGSTASGANASFRVNPNIFAEVPGAPFAYWVSDQIRSLFTKLPRFDAGDRLACRTNSVDNDFRYVRLWWEIPVSELGISWRPWAKGGAYSPYYSDVHMVIAWDAEKSSYPGFLGTENRPLVRPASVQHFFRRGLTWPRRTKSELSLRVLPAGCIFGDKGPAVFVECDSSDYLLAILAIGTSKAFRFLVELQLAAADAKKGGAARSYEVGVIQKTPFPELRGESRSDLAQLARNAWLTKVRLDQSNETSHAFVLPRGLNEMNAGLNCEAVERRLGLIQEQVDHSSFALYGIDSEVRVSIEAFFKRASSGDECAELVEDDEGDDAGEGITNAETDAAISWMIGVAFERFDVRLATRERMLPPDPEPFDPLPSRSPGMWPAGESALQRVDILLDDGGHPDDLVARVRGVAERLHINLPENLRDWLAKEFFPLHVSMYSKSRRKAPIYWQLATPSASYSVWLYIHVISKDTLFRVQNDYAAPKLAHEERRLESLNVELRDQAAAAQRKELAAQAALVQELRAFLEEVKCVAPLWNPNLDDGVIINFAPLWRLVPQNKSWQKELKSTWDTLCEGTYDWAHLAMHLWPERVVPKCARDRSLAIAHELEDVFWVEGTEGKWMARKTPTRAVDDLVRERTSPAVKSALKSLLEAPTGTGKKTKRGKAYA